MALTREQALHLLEPIWCGLIASQLRAEALLDAIPFQGHRDTMDQAAEILAAMDYIQAKGRLLEPSFLQQVVYDRKARLVHFPNVRLADADMEKIQSDWLNRHPELVKVLEERRKASIERLDTSRAALADKRKAEVSA